MGMLQEFKDFAIKGNVVDMGVGIIIGAAFGKVITSFVNDVVTPPIGLAMGGVDFSKLSMKLSEAKEGVEAVTLNYGMFIQALLDFTIVAFVMFMVIKGMNSMKAAEEEAEETPANEVLLAEIRDLLKK